MTEVLEEMKKLNVTFSTDTEGYMRKRRDRPYRSFFSEWDLLGSLIKLVKVQSDSLSALKPTISYIVNNNRCMVQYLSKMIDCFYSLEDLTTM